MSDFDEVSADLQKPRPVQHTAQVRVYLLTENRPAGEVLSAALPDYKLYLPRSPQEAAFIRKVAMKSEAEFRAECERVAKIIAPHVPAQSSLSCVYDDDKGRTTFNVEMEKTGDTEFKVR